MATLTLFGYSDGGVDLTLVEIDPSPFNMSPCVMSGTFVLEAVLPLPLTTTLLTLVECLSLLASTSADENFVVTS